CVRHARMFFNSADLNLATAAPGSFKLSPNRAMAAALARDYTAMSGRIFGKAPTARTGSRRVRRQPHKSFPDPWTTPDAAAMTGQFTVETRAAKPPHASHQNIRAPAYLPRSLHYRRIYLAFRKRNRMIRQTSAVVATTRAMPPLAWR